MPYVPARKSRRRCKFCREWTTGTRRRLYCSDLCRVKDNRKKGTKK